MVPLPSGPFSFKPPNTRKLTSHPAFYLTTMDNNNKRRERNSQIHMKLNSTILGQNWMKRELKEDIFKFLELNGNGNTAYQNLRDAIKISCQRMECAYIKRKN